MCSPSWSNGMFAPSTTNTNNVTRSDMLNANWQISRSCSECMASPRCSMLPTINPARKAPR